MRKIAQFIDARDVIALAGLAALIYGIAQIYPPAAWIVGGAALLFVSVIGMRR